MFVLTSGGAMRTRNKAVARGKAYWVEDVNPFGGLALHELPSNEVLGVVAYCNYVLTFVPSQCRHGGLTRGVSSFPVLRQLFRLGSRCGVQPTQGLSRRSSRRVRASVQVAQSRSGLGHDCREVGKEGKMGNIFILWGNVIIHTSESRPPGSLDPSGFRIGVSASFRLFGTTLPRCVLGSGSELSRLQRENNSQTTGTPLRSGHSVRRINI